MCHSRTLSNGIDNIRQRALRMVYQDEKSNFEELLEKDKSVSVQMKNLQHLATEIFKVKNGLSPTIKNKVFNFQEKEGYSLSSIHLASRNMHTAHFGTDTICSLGPKLWKLIPDKIKHASKLSAYKAKIKSWTINNYPCRQFKIFVKDLGFVEVCLINYQLFLCFITICNLTLTRLHTYIEL